MRNSSTQRFHTALWFMIAGGIPGVCFILYDLAQFGNLATPLPFLLFLYIIIPGFLAAISGLFLGADILNQDKVINARQAAARGFYVSLTAWLAYVPILSVMAGSNLQMSFLYRLFLVLMFGSVISGWLIAGLGIATGLVLYRRRKL
jgi:hypothetical protein